MTINVADLCNRLPAPASSISFRMPGGNLMAVPSPPGNGIPTAFDLMQQALTILQPALTPLTPIFGLIDTVIAIKDCIEAVPKAITQLNPKPVVDATVALVRKIDFLLQLIPPVSLIPTAADLIDAVILLLTGVEEVLTNLIDQKRRIEDAVVLVPQVPDLALAIECATETMNAQLDALNTALCPVNKFLELVNTFTSLAGLPELISLGDLGGNLEVARDGIREARAAMQIARNAIPIGPPANC